MLRKPLSTNKKKVKKKLPTSLYKTTPTHGVPVHHCHGDDAGRDEDDGAGQQGADSVHVAEGEGDEVGGEGEDHPPS